MNPRERILAATLVVIVLVGGIAFGIWKVYLPMIKDKDRELADIEAKMPQKEKDIAKLKYEQAMLNYYKQISLPGDLSMAQREYDRYLDNLLTASEFPTGSMSIKDRKLDDPVKTAGARGKKPAFVRLQYNVDGSGTMRSLVLFLEKFYGTQLLHRIRTMSIAKPQAQRQGLRPDDLDISLVVEALVIDGVEPRATLLPAKPAELPQLEKPADKSEKPAPAVAKRNYADIYERNIFYGPSASPPPSLNGAEITRLNRLTVIYENDWSKKAEAEFRDLASPDPANYTRMRASAGFDTFRIKDPRAAADAKPIVDGQVLKIDVDNRDVLFKADGKYYRIHIGESFEQAMKRPIPETEVKSLGLASAK